MDENKDFDFINEKVIKKKRSLNQILKSGGFFCIQALAFGVLAAVAFAWMYPKINFLINGEEKTTIKINSEDMTSSVPNKTGTEDMTTEPLSADEPKEYISSSGQIDLERIKESQVIVAGTNFPDNVTENVEPIVTETAGAIINADNNILVLTDYSSIMDSDIISVTFDNNVQCVAKVKQYDYKLGLVILEIDKQDILIEDYKPVVTSMGSSKDIQLYDRLVYGGVSKGAGKIISECQIVSDNRQLQMIDCVYSRYATDLAKNVGDNGFLYNNIGQMVGIISRIDRNQSTDIISVLGISELRAIIEKMSNNMDFPYIGVKGITVTDEFMERVGKEMKYGVYVENIETNSPAYVSGILKGDIITEISEAKVLSIEELSTAISVLRPGEEVDISVMRRGQDEYKKVTYKVTVGARK